ncbi:MAG: methylated-DNA--[protein]-cysteine S-methyltransferase, partial [Pseudarthrobacter sp.]
RRSIRRRISGSRREQAALRHYAQRSMVENHALRRDRDCRPGKRTGDVLRLVQPGQPVTYARYAELAGNPRAVRAAASACAFNAAALFVPCHRVIRTDGSLGGFRWGLPVKRSLLAREAG